MITVAGFNTAIDRSIALDTLVPGTVQRATRVHTHPSGKGLHVAQTIAALGEAVQLVGLTDTFHRDLIMTRLGDRGVLFHGVDLRHPLRCNLAMREENGRVTEVLDPGLPVSEAVRTRLLDMLSRWAEGSQCVVMSGSLPNGFPDDTYAQLARTLDLPCLIDASGSALKEAANSGAFLLKPNRDEASQLAGSPISTRDDAIALARNLHAQGIARSVITLGDEGAIGFDGIDLWHASIAIEANGNFVGSGDCFLAGVAVAFARGQDFVDALRLGVACGAANTRHEEIGYVDRAVVDELRFAVRMQRIDI